MVHRAGGCETRECRGTFSPFRHYDRVFVVILVHLRKLIYSVNLAKDRIYILNNTEHS
jgi:hypothetical protein